MTDVNELPFEQARAELDEVVRRLEDGSTTLEDALAAVERERGKLAALEQARPTPLTDDERAALASLARDLPRLWHAPSTTDRSRITIVPAAMSPSRWWRAVSSTSSPPSRWNVGRKSAIASRFRTHAARKSTGAPLS